MMNGVLFISPSSEDTEALSRMLAGDAIPLDRAKDLREARLKLERENFGAILTEARLPDGKWEDVLKIVAETKRDSAVVVTDNLADARFWADVLEFGAYDLLPKPFCCREVHRILANALHDPPRLTRVMPAA